MMMMMGDFAEKSNLDERKLHQLSKNLLPPRLHTRLNIDQILMRIFVEVPQKYLGDSCQKPKIRNERKIK